MAELKILGSPFILNTPFEDEIVNPQDGSEPKFTIAQENVLRTVKQSERRGLEFIRKNPPKIKTSKVLREAVKKLTRLSLPKSEQKRQAKIKAALKESK